MDNNQTKEVSHVENLSLQDLVGDYYLIGLYNSSGQEVVPDASSSKNFKTKITYSESERKLSFELNYHDTKNDKDCNITVNYNVSEAKPYYLQSPVAIMMFKYYTGDRDLIVHYFDKEKGNIVLVQQDLKFVHFYSKKPAPSQEEFPTSKILKDLGLQEDSFKTIDNTGA